MQFVAPVLFSVSVYEPGLHVVHDAVATSLYCPLGQLVQSIAPLRLSVSVVDPAAQVRHCVIPTLGWNRPAAHELQTTVETLLCCPASHAVQFTEPDSLAVLVTYPATQNVQFD